MTADPITDKAAAEAFTEKHKHRPLRWKGGFDPAQTHRNGKHYCWDSGTYERWGSARCCVPAKTQLTDGSWWCHVHEPAAYAKRAAAQQAKSDASQARFSEADRRDRERKAREAAFPLLVAALEAIAKGHNDPRALAAEVLERTAL